MSACLRRVVVVLEAASRNSFSFVTLFLLRCTMAPIDTRISRILGHRDDGCSASDNDADRHSTLMFISCSTRHYSSAWLRLGTLVAFQTKSISSSDPVAHPAGSVAHGLENRLKVTLRCGRLRNERFPTSSTRRLDDDDRSRCCWWWCCCCC